MPEHRRRQATTHAPAPCGGQGGGQDAGCGAFDRSRGWAAVAVRLGGPSPGGAPAPCGGQGGGQDAGCGAFDRSRGWTAVAVRLGGPSPGGAPATPLHPEGYGGAGPSTALPLLADGTASPSSRRTSGRDPDAGFMRHRRDQRPNGSLRTTPRPERPSMRMSNGCSNRTWRRKRVSPCAGWVANQSKSIRPPGRCTVR
jgi:hypothetical protein